MELIRTQNGEGNLLDLNDLGGSNDRIGLGDLLPSGGFVVEGAVMRVGVAVAGAEEIAAPAAKSGETNSFHAAGTPNAQPSGRLRFFDRFPSGGRSFLPFRPLRRDFRRRSYEDGR